MTVTPSRTLQGWVVHLLLRAVSNIHQYFSIIIYITWANWRWDFAMFTSHSHRLTAWAASHAGARPLPQASKCIDNVIVLVSQCANAPVAKAKQGSGGCSFPFVSIVFIERSLSGLVGAPSRHWPASLRDTSRPKQPSRESRRLRRRVASCCINCRVAADRSTADIT